MLALRKIEAARGLAFSELDPPVPGEGEVLIRVEAAGICGSDLHVDDWTGSYRFIEPALPVTLGHEFAGTVVGHGAGADAASLPPGQRVVVMPSVTCGVCAHCRAGNLDRCATRKGIGMTRDGAFARFTVAPGRNCLPVPESLDPGVAALAEPLTVASHAVARGGVAAGDRVLVLGPGTIGQGVALMARRRGADVVAVAGRDDRPRLATARALGFEHGFDLADAAEERSLTELAGPGFDVVFEATGATAAVQLGLDLLRPGGVFVAVGIHERPAPFDVTALVRRELDIRGSYRARIADWAPVLAALAERPAAFAPMITRRLPLGEGLEGFALAHRKVESKVLLLPAD